MNDWERKRAESVEDLVMEAVTAVLALIALVLACALVWTRAEAVVGFFSGAEECEWENGVPPLPLYSADSEAAY